jgi:hypothetical protein
LPWSLVGALVRGILGSSLTARHRPSLKPFLGTVLGICGGILVLAFQRDQDHARVGAISGSLIGVCAGIGALLALICALNLMPKMPMEWDQSLDVPERFDSDDHGPRLRIRANGKNEAYGTGVAWVVAVVNTGSVEVSTHGQATGQR